MNENTTTDLMFEALANQNKLVQDVKGFRQFKRNDSDESDGDHYQMNDDANKYCKEDNNASINLNNNEEEDDNEDSGGEDENTTGIVNDKTDYEKTSTKTKKISEEDEYKTWSPAKLRAEKCVLISKLTELVRLKGIKLSKNYSLDDDYMEMKMELDTHNNLSYKVNLLTWAIDTLKLGIGGVEFLNDKFDPFGFQFEGEWSNKVASQEADYYECMGEIYDKHMKNKKKMSPEMRLLLLIVGGGATVVGKKVCSKMAGKFFAGSMPKNMSDSEKQTLQAIKMKKLQQEQQKALEKKIEEERKRELQVLNTNREINKMENEYKNAEKNRNTLMNEQYMRAIAQSSESKSRSLPQRNMHTRSDLERINKIQDYVKKTKVVTETSDSPSLDGSTTTSSTRVSYNKKKLNNLRASIR